jgi:hypothetical protein
MSSYLLLASILAAFHSSTYYSTLQTEILCVRRFLLEIIILLEHQYSTTNSLKHRYRPKSSPLGTVALVMGFPPLLGSLGQSLFNSS